MARGLVNFDVTELPGLLGRSTPDLARELGPAFGREVVHRDDIVLLRQVSGTERARRVGRHVADQAVAHRRHAAARVPADVARHADAGRRGAGAGRGARRRLERLAHERPFLLSARYAADRAELRYWEEARDLEDAAALALRLWGEHRLTADLPPWRVAGLEVVDRATFQRRATDTPAPALVPAGGVRPF